MKKPLVILAGPTAVGKTGLSIALAREIGGSICSADSMQVYRRMDIGSAKITKEEMAGIRHYLIDILEPEEEFSAALFQKYAKEALKDIYSEEKIPIIAGGTGFYIQALLYDIDFTEQSPDTAYLSSLKKISEEKDGPERLYKNLREIDPESAAAIHANNVRKVTRALAYFHDTGESLAVRNAIERQKESPYLYRYYALTEERELLYADIDKRVDQMISAGLVEEVRKLREEGLRRDFVSAQGLGYKEIMEYLDGETSLPDAIDRIKQGTRHYAKRQMTWLRRERNVTWIRKEDFNFDNAKILSWILKDLETSRIIERK